MKPLCLTLLAGTILACNLTAQVLDTSACDVLKNPQSFDGKTIRVKGTAIAGFATFALRDAGC